MPAAREMLEGEAYWGRIRIIKQRLYLLEIALIAGLSIVLVFFSGSFKTNPFFASMDKLIWFVTVMMLVINAESIFFRVMQIRIGRTFSTKHIMTTNSIRRAIVIIIVAGVIAAILATPPIVEGLEDSTNYSNQATGDTPKRFLPGDPLGLSRVDTIEFRSTVSVDVYVVTQQDYNVYGGDVAALRTSTLNSNSTVNGTLTMNMPVISHMILYVVVNSNTSVIGSSAVVEFTLNTKFSSTLTAFVPMMAFIFIGVNAAWIAYLWPLSKKYASHSIYK